MSSIAVTIEMMLGMLLLAALFVGIRLDKRLRALREGEAGFALAVDELNTAALRAEAGLAELKTTIRQAEVDLGDRLQDAKAASARLQQNLAKAGEASDRLENLIVRAPIAARTATPAPAPQAEPAPRPSRVAEVRPQGEPGVFNLTRPVSRADMGVAAAASRERKTFWQPAGGDARELQRAAASAVRGFGASPGVRAPPEPGPTPRSRARVDDDLFEVPAAPARLATGARR